MRGTSTPTKPKQRLISTRRRSAKQTRAPDPLSRKNSQPKKEDSVSPVVAHKVAEEAVKRKRGRPRLKSNEESPSSEDVELPRPKREKVGEIKPPKVPTASEDTKNRDAVEKEKVDEKPVRVKKEREHDKESKTVSANFKNREVISKTEKENSESKTPIVNLKCKESTNKAEKEKAFADVQEGEQVKVEKKGTEELSLNIKTEADEQISLVKSEDGKEVDSICSSSSVASPSSSITTSHDGSVRPSKCARSRPRGPSRPGIDFTPGARLEACDFMQKWYPSKVVDVDWDDHEVLIHFERWSSRFDEWVSMDSPRLRAVTRTSARKEFRKKLQEEFKVGETVLARWVDGTMYPAKITVMNSNGTCQVTFRDDGIQKTVKLITLKKLSKEEYASIPSWIKAPSQPTSDREKPVSRERRKSHEKRSSSDDRKRSKERSHHKSKPPSKLLKLQKPSSSAGLTARRKKLLVGGIFQAKRPSTETSKSKEPEIKRESKQNPDSVKTTSPTNKSQVAAAAAETAAAAAAAETTTTETVAESEVKPTVTPPCPELSKPEENSLLQDTAEEVGTRTKRASGGVAPKEFIIEEDHNHFKCEVEDCGKSFRKESLLASHMKHYHKNLQKAMPSAKPDEVTQPKLNVPPRKEEVDAPVPIPVKAKVVKESGSAVSHAEKKAPEDSKTVDQRSDSRSSKSKSRRDSSSRHRVLPVPKPVDGEKTESNEGSASKGASSEPVTNPASKSSSRKSSKSSSASKKERSSSGKDSSSRKRKLTDEERKHDGSIKQEPLAKKENTGSNCGDGGSAGHQSSKSSPTEVKKSNKKKRLDVKPKKANKDDDFTGMSYPEMVENHFYDLDASDDIREEVVNCICRFTEEDGLMMQCENCMAWQHGTCFNIEDEKRVPERYICFACRDPKAPRESYKYWYEQGWWKLGELETFNFLPKQDQEILQKPNVLRAHSLANNIQTIKMILNSLQQKLHVAENVDHPDINHWNKMWVKKDITECNSQITSPHDNNGENLATKGELTYFDHSYSAVNRNASFGSSLFGSSTKSSEVKQENDAVESPKKDNDVTLPVQCNPTSPFSTNGTVAPNSSGVQIKQEKETEAEPTVASDIKDESKLTVDKVDHSEEVKNCDTDQKVTEKVIWQLHLLDHIEQLQNEVDRRLEEICQHVEYLESEWEVSTPQARLIDTPPYKTIKLLQSNLHKVQRLATYC